MAFSLDTKWFAIALLFAELFAIYYVGERQGLLPSLPNPLDPRNLGMYIEYITKDILFYWRLLTMSAEDAESSRGVHVVTTDDGSVLYPLIMEGDCTNSPAVLVVLIHGIGGTPAAFSRYIRHVIDTYSNDEVQLFVPNVVNRGFCSLETASKPVFDAVQEFSVRHPNTTIMLVGHSNGARIALYVDRRLDTKCVSVLSIAGPHEGTGFADLLSFFGVSRMLGHPSWIEEMRRNSTFPAEQIEYLRQDERGEKRNQCGNIHFVSSYMDMRVYPPFDPYHVVKGRHSNVWIDSESHASLVDYAFYYFETHLRYLTTERIEKSMCSRVSM